jgi:glutaminyl-peptide cyclotransferase
MRRWLVPATMVVLVLTGTWRVAGRVWAAEAQAPARAASQGGAAAAFDEGKAWEHLKQMVAIGPRPAGSAGIRQTRAYITRQISALGMTLEEQPFVAASPRGPIEMINLVLRLPGRRTDRILFTGHYDTKSLPNQRFLGASDGGSSAAFLIELARALKARGPQEFTYEIVWLDGEEAFCLDWNECSKPGAPDHTYGSAYYVGAAKRANALTSIKAMILVDMIGDKELQIRRENKSTSWLTDEIWATAKRLGHGGVFLDQGTDIEDDHVPFLEAGVPSVDIIDLDYPQWHTIEDNLDHVASKSLKIVGDVVLAALPGIERRVMR